ncbi:MAG: tetratricopeptide repeat protein [Bacteroidia bacterium]|nr:tetratricopeptide repeat protein [Bacteroidia bacterium]
MIRTCFFVVPLLLMSVHLAAAQSGRWIQPPAPDMPLEQRRDIALNAFAVGSAFEISEQPDKALTAYRAALLYDDNPAIHLVAALCAAAAGKADAAAEHLRAATATGDENSVALRMLADIHIQAGQYDSAAVVYRRLLRSDSSDLESMDMLAGLLEEHSPEEAILLYQHLLRNAPSPETAFNLARLYSLRGEADSAEAVLETLRKLDGESDALLQSLAQIAIGRGDWNAAATQYRKLCALHPGEPAYELQLAEALLSMGEWTEASQRMKRAVMHKDVGQQDKVEIGRLFFQHAMEHAETSNDAIDVLRHIHGEYPDDWRPLWFRGAVEFSKGDFENAARSFSRVLERVPSNTDAANILARTLLTLERYDETVDTLHALIDRNAASAESWLLLGYAESSRGNEEEAMQALERAMHMDPSNMEALVSLALAYDESGNFEKSDPLYERSVHAYQLEGSVKDDTYYLLLNNWAYSLAKRGLQLERALAMSEEACEQEPDNSSYLDTRAWVLHRLGRNAEALSFAEDAVARTPNNPVLFEHLGAISHALEKHAYARRAWTRALELQPDNDRIRKLLQQLPAEHGH